MLNRAIVNVCERASVGWLITDAAGVRYTTRDAWLATLAHQYAKAGTPVLLHSSGGWFYRNLTGITTSEVA